MTNINDNGNTALHYAAALGNGEDIKAEILDGHKLDCENYLGWTPLMMATRHGHMDVVQLLLDSGANATKRNKFGFSIFLMAIASGKLPLVHLLLKHLLCGGISRQSMECPLSPLSLAITFGYSEIFEYLSKQLFNVNASTQFTNLTPLMFAAAKNDIEAYNTLISKGADADLKNRSGQAAHDIVRQRQSAQQPCMHHLPPLILVNPQPSFVYLSPNMPSALFPRKSSDTLSPLFAANISPVTPIGFYPQVFFPPHFTPNSGCVSHMPRQ